MDEHADFEYTREEVLALRSKYTNANLPEHLFNPDYVTSQGKFSPDKYVECMWRNERPQKSVNRVIRSEAEILQNGSTLSPQRRNFHAGCKEGTATATARTTKSDKRSQLGTSSWSFNSRGFTNGYRNDNTRNAGRRDSNHTENLPEWMEDGPENSNELMQLGGFNEQERRLEQNFQKLGLPDVFSRQKEEEKLVLPASDVEFATQFGILDVAEIEAKLFKDEIEEPKSSRLSRFFGGERSQENRQTPTLSSQNEPVLPAVARLLSGGSQCIGPLSDPASVNPLSGLFKQAQPIGHQHVHTSNQLPEQLTSVAPPSQPVSYHQPSVPRFTDSSDTAHKSKNIDLVPTAVMLQRTSVKEQMDVRAPRFSNPNSPSPFHEHQEVGGHSNHQWQPESFPIYNDSDLSNLPQTYIPAFCQLGIHIFPLPNPIALATDNKQIAQAFKSGELHIARCIQTRLQAQMQVFAALQHFRNDKSFVIVPATDPQFEHLLESFIEQQRQLDSSLLEKFEEDLVESHNPPEKTESYQHLQSRFSPSTSHTLERFMSNQSVGGDANGSNLSILNKLPTNALTVEELERQILGNC